MSLIHTVLRIKALFPMILHKGVKASGMRVTVKALYNLHQMVTSFFLDEVFAEIIKSQTRTPTAVRMLSETMTTTQDCQS